MDPATVLAFALKLLNLVPAVIQGVTGAVDAFSAGKAALDKMVSENRDPTDDEWDALNAATQALGDALMSDDH